MEQWVALWTVGRAVDGLPPPVRVCLSSHDSPSLPFPPPPPARARAAPLPPDQFEELDAAGMGQQPYGPLVVLSETTVAASCRWVVEIVDWRKRSAVSVIKNLGSYVFGLAGLPDGRLTAGGWCGGLLTGSVDGWDSSVTVNASVIDQARGAASK